MDDLKSYRLNESNVFCLAPWVHFNNIPNGNIQPCCISGDKSTMGNIYDETVEEIWNNDKYKKFRSDILNDKPTDFCKRCYTEEKWGSNTTNRKAINYQFKDFYNDLVIDSTDSTGYLNKMNILRWDFRFSNLCNLACTSCSSEYSSTWVDINKKMWPDYKRVKFNNSNHNKEKFLELLKSQANNVLDIYFAGGEPLIQPEHYEIINYIQSLGRMDNIKFSYSTNLTTLTYKSKNVIDYFKEMKHLKLLVSLDEVDVDRLHYIRYPADLNKITENLKILKDTITGPNQHWSITPTWSLMNLHRIKYIVEYFKINDLLPNSFYINCNWENDLFVIILLDPNYLSISCSSVEWKQYLTQILHEFKVWYISEMIPMKNEYTHKEAINILEKNINRFLKAINDTVVIDKKNWIDWINKLDLVRSTSFNKTFPELDWHYTK